MKIKYSLLAAVVLVVASAPIAMAATVWDYDFGTGTGVYSTNAFSTTFLPDPQTGGGNDRVRVGTGGGSFSLINPGSGSYLQGVAPTNTSVNKFSIYDFTNPTTTVTLDFDMTLSGGSSGIWYMFLGDGATYSDNSGFAGSQTFAGLRFAFGAASTITVSNRAGAVWATVGSVTITQNQMYSISIVGNNSSASTTYGANTLASNTYDLWINGTMVTNLGKAQLANNANIDSFMFYGESSISNVASIKLDNISYANGAVPEPGAVLLGGLGLLGLLRRRR